MKKSLVCCVLATCASLWGREKMDEGMSFDVVYNSRYSYSLPKAVMESYFSGKAFDHQEFYTENQARALQEDIREISRQTFADPYLEREKLAVMTAGAPGAGKTFKLRQDLERNIGNYPYLDPVDVCLKNMERSYQTDLKSSDGSLESRKALYNLWRPGSNAAAHWVLANLIREGYAFYFGTTSTGPASWRFFEFLKAQGYQIRLLHITAPDDVRWESIKERDKAFVQTTEESVKERGMLLPQRINDTYLKYADRIEFYYRGAVKEDARLAAIWVRSPEGARHLGTLRIINLHFYEQLKAIHNTTVALLDRKELLWENTVEANSQVGSL